MLLKKEKKKIKIQEQLYILGMGMIYTKMFILMWKILYKHTQNDLLTNIQNHKNIKKKKTKQESWAWFMPITFVLKGLRQKNLKFKAQLVLNSIALKNKQLQQSHTYTQTRRLSSRIHSKRNIQVLITAKPGPFMWQTGTRSTYCASLINLSMSPRMHSDM